MNRIARKGAASIAAAVTAGLLCTGAFAAQAQAQVPAVHGWCTLEHDHTCHALCTLEHDHALDAYCWLYHDHAQGCWNGCWGWYTGPNAADGSTGSTAAAASTAGTAGTSGTYWSGCHGGYYGGHHGGGHHGRHH